MIAVLDRFFPVVEEHRLSIERLHKKHPTEDIALLVPKQRQDPFIRPFLTELFSDLPFVLVLCATEASTLSIDLLYTTYDDIQVDVPHAHMRTLGKLKAERCKVQHGCSFRTYFPVLEYLADNALVFCQKIRTRMSQERYLHSVSVAKTAYRIALAQRLDARRAFLAGMYHDVAKDLSKKRQLSIVESHLPRYRDYPAFALHQFASRILAEEQFGVEDREILSAIEWHCTGKGKMTPMEMLLYVADKCEPTRPFSTSAIYETALRDLCEAFRMVLRDQIDYLTRKGIDYHTNARSTAMFHNYLEEESKCH